MVTHPLVWMAQVLRQAGIHVVEYPGWKTRSGVGSFTPRAIMWHHDASGKGPSPGLPRMIAEQGNSSTPPPLAHVWVDTKGRWHLTAAGKAHHAGVGQGWGRIPADQGNIYAIGIETDHTVGEKWPRVQRNSLRLGTAALLRHMKANPHNALCGHKEYAPDRKIDPAGLVMDYERDKVMELMAGNSLASVVSKYMRQGVRWLGHGDPTIKHNPKNSIKQVRAEIAELSKKVDHLTELIESIK